MAWHADLGRHFRISISKSVSKAIPRPEVKGPFRALGPCSHLPQAPQRLQNSLGLLGAFPVFAAEATRRRGTIALVKSRE
jgi:hypothetical protein